jgi:hypothetical protein
VGEQDAWSLAGGGPVGDDEPFEGGRAVLVFDRPGLDLRPDRG